MVQVLILEKLNIELFKRGKRYTARLITYNEDNPKEQSITIQDENLPKFFSKLQDALYKEFETQSGSNTNEKK